MGLGPGTAVRAPIGGSARRIGPIFSAPERGAAPGESQRQPPREARMIPGQTAAPSFTPRVNPAVFILGIAALGGAGFAAGVLAADHIFGMALPGCGAGSACAKLASSVWGKVPGLDWPVSFAGVAWFAAILAAWIGCRGVAPGWLRLAATAGALGSAAFIGIMLGMGHSAPAFQPGAPAGHGAESTICP